MIVFSNTRKGRRGKEKIKDVSSVEGQCLGSACSRDFERQLLETYRSHEDYEQRPHSCSSSKNNGWLFSKKSCGGERIKRNDTAAANDASVLLAGVLLQMLQCRGCCGSCRYPCAEERHSCCVLLLLLLPVFNFSPACTCLCLPCSSSRAAAGG